MERRSWFYHQIVKVGKFGVLMIEKILLLGIRDRRSFFPNEEFPWAAEVEKSTPDILEELKALLPEKKSIPTFASISQEQSKISKGEQWKVFILRGYGSDIEKNIARCPKTWEALKHIPGMTSAFFSILEPGSDITPHRGPYKGVLRYHLGLIIPEKREKIGIEVDGITHRWEYGKSLIFDDTFIHKAWNHSDELRVILFVDFKRKMPFPFSTFNNIIIRIFGMSPYVRKGINMLK